MLLYQYYVRDEFDSVQEYAETLRDKFASGMPPDDLLRDRDSLEILCLKLKDELPSELHETTNLWRHLSWMGKWLIDGKPNSCKGDIHDICDHDRALCFHGRIGVG